MAHRIKWDDLQFVLSVAENGSLSAAARDLGVNHATVLRRVAAFEQAYGVTLFERRPSGYALNPQSQHVISTLRSIHQSVASLERSFTGLGSPFHGNIRVTSTNTICHEFLTPHVHVLSQLYPELEIELISTNSRLDLSDLEADITIRPTLNLPEDLTGEIIGKMGLRIYATADYWHKNKSADYRDHNWLGGSKSLLRSPIDYWQIAVLKDKVSHRADSFITLRQMAELGMGPTVLPCFIAQTAENLVCSPLFNFETETDIWVAAHKDLAATPRIQALMQYFIDVFKENKDLFSGENQLMAAE